MKPPLPLARVRIVLSRPSHPGNIGAAARAMKVMGLTRLFLVQPRRFPDPEATAMASGAADILDAAKVCPTLSDALSGTLAATALTARRRDLATQPLWADAAAARIVEEATFGEVAVVFGTESSGLSNEELALCRHWAMIPTDADSRSLNLAQAVQILCYELRLAAINPGALPKPGGGGIPVSHEEVERLLAHLERAAIGSGFHNPEQPKRFMLRMRRLFARAGLEKEEVDILRGLLASFEKKS